MSAGLRPAELAGSYYPAAAEVCRSRLEAWPSFDAPEGELFGALVPHGGWRYAGRIAAGTLKVLASRSPHDLLVMVGGHLEGGESIRVFIEGDWETPLGPVPTPVALAEAVAMPLSAEPETAEEYYDDNATEVLMPMLRSLWPEVPTLVVGVPPEADPGPIAREIRHQAERTGFSRIAVIGSCDLTHYGPDYRFRPRGQGAEAHRWVLEENDYALVQRFCELDAHRVTWEGKRNRSTCSPGAAATALALAKSLGATSGHCLARSTSWLEAGSPPDMHSFVGYSGVVLGRFDHPKDSEG